METYFSTDVLAEILVRLPPSARRRTRLVCKLWCDVVVERTTEMQSRAKPLLWNNRTGVAYVVDDLSSSSTGQCRELWRGGDQLVGTCNGVLCLCYNDSHKNTTGGDVTLVNPATRERLALPSLPCARQFVGHRLQTQRWDKAYSFAYHPTSGRYKVVHVPCSFDRVCEFHNIYVLILTLGKQAFWREVSAPRGTRCNLNAGIVSVDGVTHWLTDGGAARIVSFDLDDEHVTSSTAPLPALSDDYNLTEVRGRLGVVVRNPSGTSDAWVLEKGGWIHRFSVTCPWHDIPRPNFAFGEYYLKSEVSSLFSSSEHNLKSEILSLYGHHRKMGTSSSSGWRLPCDVLKVGRKDQGTIIARMIGDWLCHSYYQTFAYVSTLEPLCIYSTKGS